MRLLAYRSVPLSVSCVFWKFDVSERLGLKLGNHDTYIPAFPSFQLGTVTLAGWLIGGKSCLSSVACQCVCPRTRVRAHEYLARHLYDSNTALAQIRASRGIAVV